MEQQVAVMPDQRSDLSKSTSDTHVNQRTEGVSPESKRVLVIDDSPTIRAVVELALSQEGYIIRSFPDGIAAMKWLIGPESWSPDLAIVDIGLPRMDGYEVMRHLKANPRLAHVACIMLSVRDSKVDQLKGKLVGAQVCLSKPCTVQALSRAAHFCLAE